jgi:[protein-PII] uridylyltransferase
MIVDHGRVRERAQEAVAAVSKLFQEIFNNPTGVCLVALAGLGRGELFPNSDVDLMLFYDHENYQAGLAGTYIQRLWSRLDYSISSFVRGPVEVEQCFQSDLAGTTALLEGRFLAGDKQSFGELVNLVHEEFLPLHGDRFAQFKIKESEERHEEHDNTLAVNEPDLKEGLGGLRDAQLSVLLLALRESKNWPLEEGVILSGLTKDHQKVRELFSEILPQSGPLKESLGLLDRTREALSRKTAQHRLIKFHQESIASELKCRDKEGQTGVERFVTALFHARRHIHRVTAQIVRDEKIRLNVLAPTEHKRMLAEGIFAAGDDLELLEPDKMDAERLLELFSLLQTSKCSLSPAVRAQIREEILPGLSDESFVTPAVTRAFLALLSKVFYVAETLRLMHETRVLGRLLPEFGRLDGLAQFDAVHAYTVDEHTLRGLAVLEGYGRDQKRREAMVRLDLFVETERRDLLRLGLLLHNIGKAHGLVDHQESGEKMLPALGKRMLLNKHELSHVSGLVREHSTLARISTTRRLSDEGTIRTLIQAVSGDLTRLDHLYLLTSAGCTAVGPDVFTRWEDNLITTLYEQTRDFIEGGGSEAQLSILESVVINAPPELQNQLRQHLSLCPYSYLTETDSVIALEEMALINRIPHNAFAIKVRPHQQILRITTASKNWGNRFVHQTGVLSSLGLSIHGATTWTRFDGIGLDRFVVEDYKDRPSELLKRQIFETLHRCRKGQVDISMKVMEASQAFRRSDLDPQLEPAPSSVRVDNESSPDHTLIDVTTKDRLGLLYSLMRVFKGLHLTVHFAKISTHGKEAVDTFYVSQSAKKLAEEELDSLCKALMMASG